MFRFKKNSIGTVGEQAALRYLEKQGFKLLHKNWKCKIGEIDLIFLDKEQLVFVEVKSRRNSENLIFENITYLKQRKLRRLAEAFVGHNYKFRKYLLRIDVVGVIFRSENLKIFEIRHIRGAL